MIKTILVITIENSACSQGNQGRFVVFEIWWSYIFEEETICNGINMLDHNVKVKLWAKQSDYFKNHIKDTIKAWH